MIKFIWNEIFADPEKFAEFYFDVICRDNKIFVAKENEEIIGMVHLNPYNVIYEGQEEKTYYIVGVCVREGYRFRGIMREMMNKVMDHMKAEGVKFTFLMPKDEDYYVGLGFRNIYGNIDVKYNEIVEYKDYKENEDLIFKDLNTYSDEELDSFGKSMNELLGEKFSYYSKRDVKYLKRLLGEHHCQSGSVMAGYYKENFIGYFSYDIYEDALEDKNNMFVERCYAHEEYLFDLLEYIKKLAIKNNCKNLTVTISDNCYINSCDLRQLLIEREGGNIKIFRGKGIMAYSFIEDEKIDFMKNKSFFDEIV